MPPKRLTRCEHLIWSQKQEMFVPCNGPSFRKVDGKYYCRYHDPITRREKADAVLEKRKERMKVSKTKAALRQWRNYSAHPYIKEMRKNMEALFDVMQELVVLKTVVKLEDPQDYEKRKGEAWKTVQLLLEEVKELKARLAEMDEASELKED